MARETKKGGKGHGKKHLNKASIARRRRSWLLCNVGSIGRPCKKDRHVAKSSHGVHANPSQRDQCHDSQQDPRLGWLDREKERQARTVDGGKNEDGNRARDAAQIERAALFMVLPGRVVEGCLCHKWHSGDVLDG